MVASILNTATSGLISTGLATQMRANNTVNMQTPEFESTQPVRTSVESGGVSVSGQRGGRVELSNELLGLMQEEHSFTSNAAVFRTADDMYREAADLKK